MSARQSGRYLLDILQGDEYYKSGPECNLEFDQTIRKSHQYKDNINERRIQFLEVIRCNDNTNSNFPANPIRSPIVANPTIRTYTRKTPRNPYFKEPMNKTVTITATSSSPSTIQQKNYLKFVPPNVNTLVAARSMLANIPRFKKLCGNFDDTYQGNRMTPSNILKNGFKDHIFFGLPRHGSMHLPPNEKNTEKTTDDKNGKILPEEADRRLRNRFLSLLFFPAIMSITKPNERSNMFDLDEEEGVVAADDPLDTNVLIEENKLRVANTPIIKVIPKRRQ